MSSRIIELYETEQRDGEWHHVYARSIGDTPDEALAEVRTLLLNRAKDKAAFIRVAPEVNSYTDFDTKVTTHCGFVRFSYSDRPGEWDTAPPSSTSLAGFGEAAAKPGASAYLRKEDHISARREDPVRAFNPGNDGFESRGERQQMT